MQRRAVRSATTLGAALLLASPAWTGARAEPPPIGSACTITGTSAANTLTGTADTDVICGLGGNDTISGLGGDDLIVGGPGSDTVDGGDGADRIQGGDGDDLLSGGTGFDEIAGQSGADTVDGQGGNDRVVGGVGNDVVRGGDGNDLMFGEGGDDDLDGGANSDKMYGDDGNDDLVGGTGIDTLNDRDGSPFVDHLTCGEGTGELAYVDVYDSAEPDCERIRVLDREPPVAVDDTRTVFEDSVASTVTVIANDTDVDGGAIGVASVTQPDNGTVVKRARSVTYRPDANYCNSAAGDPKDVFTYTLAPGGSTATVTVTVRCVDDAPVAVDDAATVGEDANATTIAVRTNDTDIDAGPKTVATVTQPADGTVAITSGGTGVTYKPDANYCNGGSPTDDFTYTLAPGGDTGTVEVTVTCADDAPVAVDDTATVAEDHNATTVDVLANDTDDDSAPETVDAVTQPDHGTVAITNAGADLTYEPDPDYCNGGSPTDDFTYTLAPGGDTATVKVTVTCVDDAPVAVDDVVTVLEDAGPATLDLLANDTDADDDPFAIASVTQPGNGTVVLANDGEDLTYEPDGDYCNAPPGTVKDTFTYTMTPGGDTATVSVTVTCVNDAPTITGIEGTALAYTENGPATPVTADAVVNDVDSPNFLDGTLTVDIIAGGTASEKLEIRNQGNGAGQIDLVSGTTVRYEGTPIGTFVAGDGTTPLVVELNANATPAAVQALVRNVTYRDTSDTPAANRTVRFVLTDGDGGTSAAASRGVLVAPVNDAPALAAIEGAALGYTEQDAATIVTTATTVTDVDSANFDSGVLTVDLSVGNQADDRLDVRNQGTGSGQIGVSGSTVSFQGTAIGTVTGGIGTQPLVVLLNATATPAAVQALVRNLTFRSLSDDPTASKTVRFVLTDGDGGTSAPATRGVTSNPINDPPAIDGIEGSVLAYAENAPATVITATGTVTDPDSVDFNGGSLTIDLSAGGQADDLLEVRNQGSGAGQISVVNTSTVRYQGVSIGLLSGGSGSTPLVISLDSDATPAAVQALLRNITFRNTGEDPGTSRTARFVLTDGDGGTSTAATRAIAAAPANDAPVIGSVEGGTLGYAENAGAVLLTTAGTISDPDSTNFETGTLTVDLSAGGQAEDRLEIRNEGTGTGQISVSGNSVVFGGTSPVTFGSFTGGTGTTPLVITLNSFATPARTQALLRNLTYRNVSDNPSTANRTVRFVLTDGDGGTSTVVSRTVTVTASNDAPVLAAIEGATLAYTENDAATPITATTTVADVDSANFQSGTLSISFTTGGPAEDRLDIRNQGTAAGQIGVSGANVTFGGTTIGTYPGATSGSGPLVVTLNASATPAATQALVRNITYRNASDTPVIITRVVQMVLTDGDGGTSAPVTRSIAITATNDAPVIADPQASTTYTEQNGTAALVSPGFVVSDVDNSQVASTTVTITSPLPGDTLTFTDQNGITGSFASGVLTLTGTSASVNYVNALRTVGFRNTTSDTPGTSRSFVIQSSDGSAASNSITRTIAVSPVNDVPVVALDASTTLGFTEGNAGYVNLTGANATVTDVDNTTLASLKVTISAGFDASFDLLRLDPAIAGFTSTYTGGVLTLAKAGGTVAEYQTALRNVQFRNTDDDPDNRNDGTANATDANRTLSVVVNDGVGDSVARTRAATITPVNDAPGVPSTKPTVAGVRNTTLVAGVAATGPHSVRTINMVSNAVDPDGLESAITVVPVSNAATAQSGRITLTGAGTVRYEPPASATLTSDTYNYLLTDGTTQSAATLFTVNLSGAVWYVADGATGTMDGTAARPFDTIAAALALPGSQTVHVTRGSGDGTLSGAVVLGTGDKLIGGRLALTNTEVGSSTVETLMAAGTAPLLTAPSNVDVVTLASATNVGGVDIDAVGAANAVFGTSTPSVTLRSLTVVDGATASTQPSIELAGTGNGLTFGSAVTLNGNQAGALTVANAVLSGTVASVTVTGSSNSPAVSLTSTTGSLTFSDLDAQTTNHSAVVLSNASAITVLNGTVATSNRPVVDATGLGAGTTLAFTEADSINSTTDGVNLDGTGGWSFTAGAGSSISGAQQIGFDVNGGSGLVTYPGTIASFDKSVDVTGRSGTTRFTGNLTGRITVDGNTAGLTEFLVGPIQVISGTNDAIALTNNTGHTIRFQAALSLTATSGSAFRATGGGTVAVVVPGGTPSYRSAETDTGIAVNIANTTISAEGVSFSRVFVDNGSAATTTSGIVLNNTGKTGPFSVTGIVGTGDSGGTIKNTTGPGISLTNTGSVSLHEMRLDGTDRSGVLGTGVSGFSMTSTTILNAGDTRSNVADAAVAFNTTTAGVNNLDGAVTITGNTFTSPYGGGVDIRNFAGTISNATISNNTITSAIPDPFFQKGSGISLLLRGSANTVASLTKATIANNTITGMPCSETCDLASPNASGIVVLGGNTTSAGATAGTYGVANAGTDVVTISGNLVTGDSLNRTGSAIWAGVIGRGQGHFAITGNGTAGSPLANTWGPAIRMDAKGSANVWFKAANNVINANNMITEPGIRVLSERFTQGDAAVLANPTVRATVTGNTVSNTAGPGIHAFQGDSNGFFDIRLQGNVTSNISSGQVFSGIVVRNGSSGSGSYNPTLCAEIAQNTAGSSSTSPKPAGIGLQKQGTTSTLYKFGIPGLATSATNAATESYVSGLNPASDLGASGSRADVQLGQAYTPCTLLPLP